jgi:hypothetical protein
LLAVRKQPDQNPLRESPEFLPMRRGAAIGLVVFALASPSAAALHAVGHGEMGFQVAQAYLEVPEPGLYHVNLSMEGRIRCEVPNGVGTPSSQLRLRPSPPLSENGSNYWTFRESQTLVGLTWRAEGSSNVFVVRGQARLDLDSHAMSRVEQRSLVNFTRDSVMGQAGTRACTLDEQTWHVRSPELTIVVLANGEAGTCDEVFPCHGATFAPSAQGEWVGRPRYVGSFGGTSRVPENALFFLAIVILGAVVLMGAWARRRR